MSFEKEPSHSVSRKRQQSATTAATSRESASVISRESVSGASRLEEMHAAHTHLWRAQCIREGLRGVLTKDPKSTYDKECVVFYLLELSSRDTRQDFFLCPTLDEVKQVLSNEFGDKSRLLIQHLCRLGLDINLYTGFKDRLSTITPLYNFFRLDIGQDCILTIQYLGGIEDEDEESSQTIPTLRRNAYSEDQPAAPIDSPLDSPADSPQGLPSDPQLSSPRPIDARRQNDERRSEAQPLRRMRRNGSSATSSKRVFLSRQNEGIYLWSDAPKIREEEDDSGNPPEKNFVQSFVFFREGRICRYQITRWVRSNEGRSPDQAQQEVRAGIVVDGLPSSGRRFVGSSSGSFCAACPPELFCDIVFFDINLKWIDSNNLPKLNRSGSRTIPSALAQDETAPPNETIDVQFPSELGGCPIGYQTFAIRYDGLDNHSAEKLDTERLNCVCTVAEGSPVSTPAVASARTSYLSGVTRVSLQPGRNRIAASIFSRLGQATANDSSAAYAVHPIVQVLF